ncbi:MAG: hypothetical protein M3Z50_04175 [Actinomycetota bacterium]|nr:hypothetical protein [Actinomycetota bacterium]
MARKTTRRDEVGAENAPAANGRGRRGAVFASVRGQLARLVRLVFWVLALFLAVGALLVALRHNVHTSNPIVKFVLNVADTIDGPFSRNNGVFVFHGKHSVTKNAVVNWGLAAVVYLIIGRVLERLIAPRSKH